MRRTPLALAALLVLTAAGAMRGADDAPAEPDAEAARALRAYEAARPSDAELGLFRLDWAASLQEARERAAREKRPIVYVATMQLTDAGDLRGGHC